MEIIFCDIYKKFIDSCDKQIKANSELQNHFKFATYFGDIRDLKVKNAAFISPANSYMSYGGGIDLIYNRDMFPNIEKKLMNKISNLLTKCTLERSFDELSKGTTRPMLPIGEAIITPLTEYEKYNTCYLISAPTMVYPMSIKGTDNPYKAFMACLKIVKDRDDIKTIVCPGLGTGVGGIDAEECAKQIFDALNDYTTNGNE